ncbi:hypothetical protein SVIOM74S_02234 [Streptomyces violarus]
MSDAQAAVDLLRQRAAPGRRRAREGVPVWSASRSVAQALLENSVPRARFPPADEADPLRGGHSSLFLTLVGTPLLIKLLARKGYGQYIRDDGPRDARQQEAAARPPWAAFAFILATVAAYLLAKVITGDLDPEADAAPASSVCWCSV